VPWGSHHNQGGKSAVAEARTVLYERENGIGIIGLQRRCPIFLGEETARPERKAGPRHPT